MPSPVSGAGEKDSLIADLALSTFALWLSRSPVVSGPHLLPTAICLLSFSLEWLIAYFTQHLLLSTDLLIADFALYFLAGRKFKIQDPNT